MAHTPVPPVPQQIDLTKQKVENPLNITPQYSNLSYCVATDWDIRLVFSELIPQAPTGVRIELRGNIVMAPTQAKALIESLKTTVAQFEQRHGTIQWPPKNPAQQLH